MRQCLTAPKKTWGGQWRPRGLFPELTLAKMDRYSLRNAPRFLAASVTSNSPYTKYIDYLKYR